MTLYKNGYVVYKYKQELPNTMKEVRYGRSMAVIYK